MTKQTAIIIRGQSYTVEAVIPWAWIAPQHPEGPLLVIVKPAEQREEQTR